MKKLIIGIIVLGGIGGGYYYVLNYVRAPLSMLQGKTVVTTRGDLEVPITASGHIRPASVTNVKSKASGEVNEIFAHIGDMVTTSSGRTRRPSKPKPRGKWPSSKNKRPGKWA